MALRTLVLNKKLENKKHELEELRARDAEFEKREVELTAAIDEANTDEEKAIVEEMVDKFDEEKTAHDTDKATLEVEINRMEAEIAEIAKEPPVERKKDNRKEVKTMPIDMNIRALPKHVRAFDALPAERREAIVRQPDVQEFLTQIRNIRHTRAISGADLTIPVVFLDLISENMYRYSKLLNRVRVRNVNGQARQTIAGIAPEAVWTEMCGAINELDFVFNQITVDGYKVAGYIPVCNSLLEDSDIALASWIVEMISESLGYAKDKAILYGKGAASKMPLGIVTRLAQTQAPSDYPANAPAWVDLHTSNVIQIEDELTGAAFWSALMIATGNTFTRYSRGNQFWAMNSKTYALLKSKVITFTATGDIVSNVFGTLPIINGDIDILEFIPDGDIIGGYGDLYLWAQRSGTVIDMSEHVQFIQDNTVYRGKERADGAPIIPGAFVAININGSSVTTVMDFAADNANDAQLTALAIGSQSLTPVFNSETYSYTLSANAATAKIEATPAQAGALVEISYNGANVRNGGTVTWTADGTAYPLTVTVKQGNAVRVYTVQVTKAAG